MWNPSNKPCPRSQVLHKRTSFSYPQSFSQPAFESQDKPCEIILLLLCLLPLLAHNFLPGLYWLPADSICEMQQHRYLSEPLVKRLSRPGAAINKQPEAFVLLRMKRIVTLSELANCVCTLESKSNLKHHWILNHSFHRRFSGDPAVDLLPCLPVWIIRALIACKPCKKLLPFYANYRPKTLLLWSNHGQKIQIEGHKSLIIA